MALLDTFINISISEAAAVTPTASTTVPLLVGTSPKPDSWAATDWVHAYNSAADVLADGFADTSPEYQAALLLCSQTTVPSQFYVGVRKDVASAGHAQVNTIVVQTVADGATYAFAINGATYSITSAASSTAKTIGQQLQAAVAADGSAPVTTSFYNDNLVLTGTTVGVAFTISGVTGNLQNNLSYAAEAAESGALDVADLEAIQTQNDTWYGLVLVGASDAEIQTAAAWVQSQRKVLFAATAATDSVLIGKLTQASYNRTALAVSPGAAMGVMPAWVGGQLPQTPGANNWAYKTLVGVTPDTLTTTQQATILGNPAAGVAGNHANAYVSVGGTPLTMLGTVASGDYIDNVIGLDALFFAMQAGVLNVLQSAQKVPMTDAGVAIIEGAVRVALQQAQNNGFLVGGWTVAAPKVANWPQVKRQARICPTITFSATMAGAINSVNISGAVSV